MTQPIRQTEGFNQVFTPGRIRLLARQPQRQINILPSGQGRHQVKRLEDKPHVLTPELGQLVILLPVQFGGTNTDAGLWNMIGSIQCGKGLHQR